MFKRYLYRNYRILSAIQHSLTHRLTPTGLLVLWGAFFAAGLGMDTDLTVAYQGFSFLICLVVGSFLLGWLSRGRYSVQRIVPRFGTVGVALPYRISVQNLTSHTQRGLRFLENLGDPRPDFAQFVATPEPGEQQRNWFDRTYGYYRWQWLLKRNVRADVAELPLPPVAPKARIEVSHTLLPRRRGRLDFAGSAIAWSDPFGLFRSLFRISSPQSVLILPKRYPVPSLALPGAVKYQQGGVAMAAGVGESEEFISLREYRPGDPLRHIHWRSCAKSEKLIVKEFQEEFFHRHALILDTFGSEDQHEVFEEAVSVAASFACSFQTRDSLLDLMFVGPQAFCFTAGRGLAHTEQMLEILAAVALCQDKPFSSLKQLIFQHLASVSGCLCVFMSWDEERQDLVGRITSMGIPVKVLVIQVGPAGAHLRPGPLAATPGELHRLEVGKIAEGLAHL